MIRRAQLRKVVGAVLGGSLLMMGAILSPAAAAPPSRPGAVSAQRNWLAQGPYFNDPRATGAAQDVPRQLVIHHFDHAAAGSSVRVNTWNLTDSSIADAMVRAMARGVYVQLILSEGHCDDSAAAIVTYATVLYPGSSVICPLGSSRSDGGAMHQKSYTFSMVDSTPFVTIVGSANATVEGNVDQWTDMYQFVNRADIYGAYTAVHALQQQDVDLSKPYSSFSFDDGRTVTQFYPVNDPTPTAADDPVHARITSIPTGRKTVIRVAMYTIGGERGAWLIKDLIAQRKAGSTVIVLTGPPVSDAKIRKMRAAGISVTKAFDPGCVETAGCDYIHLKLMTARYVSGKSEHYRVWTGSDNWTTNALNNDEVVQQVSGETVYDQYAGFIDRIRRTY